MQSIQSLFTRPLVLFILLIGSLIIGYCFTLFTEAVGGQILDMLYTEEEARAALAAMTAEQKQAHIKMTLLLDILYPITLSGVLGGLILKFSPGWFKWTVLLPLIALVLDYGENTIHVLALADIADYLSLKDFFTGSKYLAFLASAIVALIALALAGLRRLNSKS